MFQSKPPEYKEFEDDRYQFNDQSIRKAFIRKVYLILMLQMITSLGIIASFMYNEPLRFYVETNLWPVITAFIVTFAVIITLACCGDVRRQFPLNMILLGLFTVAEGFILGIISAMSNSHIVFLAVGITAVVFLGLTLFSLQTRWDFTTSGGILSVCLIVLLVFGIITMIFPGRIMIMIYASIGAIIFGCYIVYDTQLLMGGDHKFALSPEEYIFAVLALYLDIVNLFLTILMLLNSSRRR